MLAPAKMRVVYNGIHLAGYEVAPRPAEPPVLGYFARMCREKGLDLLVEAFVLLRKRAAPSPTSKLKVGGSCGPADMPVVESAVQKTLSKAGLLHSQASFHPNLSLAEKQAFYRTLSMFSHPGSLRLEAFGLYLVESPWRRECRCVQPDHGAFPELIEASGGGTIFPAGKPKDLADALQRLWELPDHGRSLGLVGRKSAETLFTVPAMAQFCRRGLRGSPGPPPRPGFDGQNSRVPLKKMAQPVRLNPRCPASFKSSSGSNSRIRTWPG